MTAIDRRTVLRSVLGGVVVTIVGVAVTPKIGKAIPFAAAKANPLAKSKIGPVEPEELEDLIEKAQVVIGGPRRRRRRWVCWRNRWGRRVCDWRWRW
jgi:hypothetical protein